MTTPRSLVGSWRKREGAACAASYPASLVVLAGGQYRGFSDPPGEFTIWDVGSWELRGPAEIALSTANDAIIVYRFALGDGLLDFTDPDGCRFGYAVDPGGHSSAGSGADPVGVTSLGERRSSLVGSGKDPNRRRGPISTAAQLTRAARRPTSEPGSAP